MFTGTPFIHGVHVVGHSSGIFRDSGKIRSGIRFEEWENLTENWLEIGLVCKRHRCKSKSVRVNLCVYTYIYIYCVCTVNK